MNSSPHVPAHAPRADAERPRVERQRGNTLPILLTADEAADLLRTTRRAIYIMRERGQLPGVTRLGRRVLFRSAVLLEWLAQKRAPSPAATS
jgi:excisionase family DNA binding protein